jgi:calcineurin-like phosphoesterase family protein
MRSLLISDLHFSSGPNEAYRWDLFNQIIIIGQQRHVDRLYILGDLTNNKDNHPSILVNQIVDGLLKWSQQFKQIIILRGNHDHIGTIPFFKFVDHFSNITFISDIVDSPSHLWLPHTRNPAEDWKHLNFRNKMVFSHVSVKGAVYENKQTQLDGVEASIFNSAKIAFSGDIHTPQWIDPLIYVGCPYPVRFGDTFKGNCIILDEEDLSWARLELDFPQRLMLDVNSSDHFMNEICHKTYGGDQIKVRLHLTQETMGTWRDQVQEIKETAKSADLHLVGLELIKEQFALPNVQNYEKKQWLDFDQFCKNQTIAPDLCWVGNQILEEVI